MTPERERQILVAFEQFGPERIKMALENAYPFVPYFQRDRGSRCFVGCATTAKERTRHFPQYGFVIGRFPDHSFALERAYEGGDHERLRTLAIEWLEGVKSPPKERRFTRIGMAVMLLLLVLL